MTPAGLLEPVLRIATQAGERIMEIWRTGDFTVTHKGDDSPLTQADLAAHRHIADELAKLAPEIPLLSEEDADIPYSTRRSWTRYWLVDPLDGTREFIRRNPDFTVNIALIVDGYPQLGVVVAPALGISWIAAEGAGCWRIENGERRRLSSRRKPELPVFVVSQSHRNPALARFLASAPKHEAMSRGSSLKFCLIAEGLADLYPRTGPISEWDSGAGQCVAEQAGAQVLRLPERTRLGYNEKASLINPLFAVIGDPTADWDAVLASIGP